MITLSTQITVFRDSYRAFVTRVTGNEENADFLETLLYYVAFAIYLASYTLNYTTFELDLLCKVLLMGAMLLLLLKLIVQQYNVRELLFTVVLGFFGLISYIVTDDSTIFKLLLFVLAGQRIDIKKLAKIVFVEVIAFVILTVGSCLLGVIEAVETTRGGVDRSSLGFTHPNRLGSFLLAIWCAYAIMRFPSFRWSDLLPCVMLLVFVEVVADSRGTEVMLPLVLVLSFVCSKASGTRWQRPLIVVMACTVVGVAVFSFYLMLCYDSSLGWMNGLDDLLSGRLSLAHAFFEEFSITAFGQDSNTEVAISVYTTFVIDNAYAKLFILYGFVPALIVLPSYVALFVRAWRRNVLPVCLYGAFVYACFGFVESQMLHFAMNYCLVACAALLFPDQNGLFFEPHAGEQTKSDSAEHLTVGKNRKRSLAQKILYYPAHPRDLFKRVAIKVGTLARYCRVKTIRLDGVKPSNNNVIVSLTSYGERLQTVLYSIKSILDQTVVPGKVILYLADDVSEDQIPNDLRALCNAQFEIRTGCANLKPHKKYFYAMQEFPESIVITIDDDVLYPRDTIATLLNAHEEHPGCVVARRVHKMTARSDGGLAPYEDWICEWGDNSLPSKSLLAVGVGGVLYPPHCLPHGTFDETAISELCLNADDIWLKVAETSAGVPVAYAPNRLNHPYETLGVHGEALCQANVFAAMNDSALVAAMKYFGVSDAEFLNE